MNEQCEDAQRGNEQPVMKEVAKIKVLVVDDHPIMRVGIAAIIDATPDMTVVAQAGSGEEAVELFEKFLPDITLMDLRLPGMSGVDAIRILMSRHRNAKFVVLTTYEGDEDIHQALQAGARSYIIKGMPHEALVSALRRVHGGGRFLPQPVSRALNSRIPNSDLSAREREVLELIVHGKSNKEIASDLGITEIYRQLPRQRDSDAPECQRPHPGGRYRATTRTHSFVGARMLHP